MQVNIQSSNEAKTDDAVKKDQIINALKTNTPAEINQWCDNNITNLAEAKDAFKILFKLSSYVLRKIDKYEQQ